MKANGLSDCTINFTRKALYFLAKNCNLNNPEEVKTFIANRKATNHYKRNLCIAYNKFVLHNKLEWQMPIYIQPSKLPNIPKTETLKQLISYARKNLAVKLMISMETGLRPVEVMNLKVKDVNLENRTITPTTAKHGSARILKISNTTKDLLKRHIVKYKRTSTDEIFKGDAERYGRQYRQMRNNLAEKLENPAIRQIRLYDLRHYFATMLYSKTRDILYVKQQLGHRKIDNTLIYTQLVDQTEEEEYICKTATNVKQATTLIENGFQYVTEMDGLKLFRKRK